MQTVGRVVSGVLDDDRVGIASLADEVTPKTNDDDNLPDAALAQAGLLAVEERTPPDFQKTLRLRGNATQARPVPGGEDNRLHEIALSGFCTPYPLEEEKMP